MKKDNIAILSLPLTWNYGGILQTYALKTKLEQFGFTTTVIVHRKDRKNIILNILLKTKWNIVKLCSKMPFLDRHKLIATQSFKEKRIKNFSPVILNSYELQRYLTRQNISGIVVGSDQVWNNNANPCLKSYSLDFDSTLVLKKFSYAASYAKPDWEYSFEDTKALSKSLRDFELISVRERDTVSLFQENLQLTPLVHADPTLLLEEGHYKGLIDKVQPENEEYIFEYILDNTADKSRLVNVLSNTLCCRIKSLADKSFGKPSVENWLAAIIHSKCIITDSYHGVLFALIFNKEFFAILNKNRGSSRFFSILEQFQLLDRIIIPDEKIDVNFIEEKLADAIDWQTVNLLKKKFAENSAKDLYEALSR